MGLKLLELNKKIQAVNYEKPQSIELIENVKKNPLEQFIWYLEQAFEVASMDPSAMVLATVDERGWPDTRVVLLKELDEQGFIFFTSYASKKAQDLTQQAHAALNFYWPELFCQIRIRGTVEKLARERSEAYFSTRPREAQLGTHAWVQSSSLKDRQELEQRVNEQAQKFTGQPIPCPQNWGGYILRPFEYEFFQKRQWRMHDRWLYTLKGEEWSVLRLAP